MENLEPTSWVVSFLVSRPSRSRPTLFPTMRQRPIRIPRSLSSASSFRSFGIGEMYRILFLLVKMCKQLLTVISQCNFLQTSLTKLFTSYPHQIFYSLALCNLYSLDSPNLVWPISPSPNLVLPVSSNFYSLS